MVEPTSAVKLTPGVVSLMRLLLAVTPSTVSGVSRGGRVSALMLSSFDLSLLLPAASVAVALTVMVLLPMLA